MVEVDGEIQPRRAPYLRSRRLATRSLRPSARCTRLAILAGEWREPGTHQVVGVYGGGIAGTGYAVRLDPGQRSQVTVIGGTARCDGAIGSALPAGQYQMLAVVMDETGKPPRYLAPPVTFTVTPRRS